MIRKATLDESMDAQRDHARRCGEMVKQGVVANSPENEKKSYTDATQLIPERFAQQHFTNVLDLGCQTLEAYPYLKEALPNMRYFGLEILPELVEEMQQKYPDRDIMQGYMEKLPFQDDSIDVVWARHVLEHASDIEVVFNEIKRVLRDNGVVIFTVPTGVHNEPAHYIEVEADEWDKIFTDADFLVYGTGQHDFNLNEYFGVLAKRV